MASEQLSWLGFQRERKAPGLVYPDQISHVLLSHPQWVCWRYIDRGEGRKPDKQPVNPRTLANAGIHWANTWASFDVAYATYLRHHSKSVHGIGFVLTQADPYVVVDLDSCIDDVGIEDSLRSLMMQYRMVKYDSTAMQYDA